MASSESATSGMVNVAAAWSVTMVVSQQELAALVTLGVLLPWALAILLTSLSVSRSAHARDGGK